METTASHHSVQALPSNAPFSPASPTWKGRAVGLLDLDAFFASVEQLDHPEWRGKPVIVGGDAAKRGVVSTASYEARAFGVHSAMPSAMARRLCPNAIWVHGRHERYREMSRLVMACIEQETPYVEAVSIDEAYFDVTPGRYSRDDPVEVCRRISAAVAALGITCSMGLSTSKTVSKIASERNKPNGITVIYPGTEAAFLAPMSVKALPGVGPRTKAALEELGIRTLAQLAAASPSLLEARLGVHGPRLAERAAGIDNVPVAPCCAPDDTKSVSSERTFAEDLTERQDIESALGYIAIHTARRLRAKNLKGRTITVKCTYRFSESRSARTTLQERTDDELVIAQAARRLLDELWSEGTPIRLLGIGVSNWDEKPEQLSLFDDVEAIDHRRDARSSLTKTADRLRERFGVSAVRYGSELRFDERVSKTSSTHRNDEIAGS